MSSRSGGWKLSNLYTPKYTRDIKFIELLDLEPITISIQSEEDKNSEIVITPSDICDSVLNSQSYKELVSALNISTCENIDVILMIKEKLIQSMQNMIFRIAFLMRLHRDQWLGSIQNLDKKQEIITHFFGDPQNLVLNQLRTN